MSKEDLTSAFDEGRTGLKPCPFCGGKAGWWGDSLGCDVCNASGPTKGEDDTREQSIAAWNRRATTAAGWWSAVPGWKLVPVEATREMISSAAATPGMKAIDGASTMHQMRGNPLDQEAFKDGCALEQVWRAMLAACPAPPSQDLTKQAA